MVDYLPSKHSTTKKKSLQWIGQELLPMFQMQKLRKTGMGRRRLSKEKALYMVTL
jgi:hypothetical protein